MKKIFTIAICVLLLLLISIPALAAEETVIKVTASEKELHRGDVVTFTVSISGETEYSALGLRLSYDSEVYEFVPGSAEMNAEATAGAQLVNFNEANGDLAITFGTQTKKYSGALMTFQLKVLSDASFEKSTVSVEVSKMTDANRQPIDVKVKSVKLSVKCVHEYAYSFVEGETSHTGTCKICGDVISGDHKWDEGTTAKKPTCTKKGQEKFTCTICSATKLADLKAIGHAWKNECDSTCENGCGKTRDVDHKFETTISSDKTRHWYQCEVCGKEKDVYKHTPGPEATETEDQTCEICGYVIQEALGHTYDDECDDTCNTCDETREAPHAYSSEWRGNAEGHWHMCMACQEESEVIPHEPGAEATEDTPQVCTECNYWIKFPLNHVHTFGETWLNDENTHWKSCSECFENEEGQEHEWDEGTVITEPTATEEGSILYVCTVCGYERTEAVMPVVTPSEPSVPSEPSEPAEPSQPVDTPSDPAEKEGFPWWIVAAVAAVLMLIGIILLILEWRRSAKTNMHGKYSG